MKTRVYHLQLRSPLSGVTLDYTSFARIDSEKHLESFALQVFQGLILLAQENIYSGEVMVRFRERDI